MTVSVGDSRRRRVLVTGANGFVGSAVVDYFVRSGTAVTAAVRRSAMMPVGVRVVAVGDIDGTTDWTDALRGCDAVVHLAARVHVLHDQVADPLASYRAVNVDGTLALARQASAAGAKRFIFLSSIKVNGEATGPARPFQETDAPAPTDAYGISKHEAECGLLPLAQRTELEIVIIRPPLIYGPGVRANFLSMARWLSRGIPLTLGALHDNRRSLLGLDNLVDLLRVCLHHPAAANQLFLAADGADLSTTELLRRTAGALGVRARLIPVPARLLAAGAAILGKRAVFQRLCGSLQVDIGKAERVLGWRPPVSVDEGLVRAVRTVRARTT